MAGQSVVDICNSALQRVGAATIMNLADNTREARACAVAYDSNRRDELRRHFWKFAIKRVVLAPDVAAPVSDFTYQFSLPTDCLRIVFPNDPYLDWSVEGRKILTNSAQSPFGVRQPTVSTTGSTAAKLSLRYVADITDVTQWDASFYSVLSLSMASDICEVLTNSTSKKAAIRDEYKDAMAEARVADAFESLPQDPPDDDWWLVRF
jgi:hypothetical protein